MVEVSGLPWLETVDRTMVKSHLKLVDWLSILSRSRASEGQNYGKKQILGY